VATVTPAPRANAGRISIDRLALMTKISRMYHNEGLRQPEIAERLYLSQSRVSRLLKEAVAAGIIRTIVIPPPGVHSDLEDAVRLKYGLSDVVIADSSDKDEAEMLRSLGSAGAVYLETALRATDRVGISSWSSTLLATVDAMAPGPTRTADEIVQVIGGVGNPSVQVNATRLTDSLASVTGAIPRFLPAPGIVASEAVRDALLQDPHVSELSSEWGWFMVVLAGIGTLQPSPLLKSSGNAISEENLKELRGLRAVGDVCLRFYDADGILVESELNSRVVGISSQDLRNVPRKVGIAGGRRKFEAIRGAILGKWIDVLITDVDTATRLVT
jgi:DNA-binding transcriptional regulator LsrR (DeoR family)